MAQCSSSYVLLRMLSKKLIKRSNIRYCTIGVYKIFGLQISIDGMDCDFESYPISQYFLMLPYGRDY